MHFNGNILLSTKTRETTQYRVYLHLSDLLKGSFIPEHPIRELRDLTRYKTKLTHQISAEKNRFQKILEDANIKLSSVLNDVFGATKIILIL